MRFTEDEVRAAFWKTFHRSGEQWFNYLGTDDECTDSTQQGWEDFLRHLKGDRLAIG